MIRNNSDFVALTLPEVPEPVWLPPKILPTVKSAELFPVASPEIYIPPCAFRLPRFGAKEILTEKIDDLHKLAKALLTYETLSGEEIENLINKNVYPKDKEDVKLEDNDKGSALSSLGLKPKIVH